MKRDIRRDRGDTLLSPEGRERLITVLQYAGRYLVPLAVFIAIVVSLVQALRPGTVGTALRVAAAVGLGLLTLGALLPRVRRGFARWADADLARSVRIAVLLGVVGALAAVLPQTNQGSSGCCERAVHVDSFLRYQPVLSVYFDEPASACDYRQPDLLCENGVLPRPVDEPLLDAFAEVLIGCTEGRHPVLVTVVGHASRERFWNDDETLNARLANRRAEAVRERLERRLSSLAESHSDQDLVQVDVWRWETHGDSLPRLRVTPRGLSISTSGLPVHALMRRADLIMLEPGGCDPRFDGSGGPM